MHDPSSPMRSDSLRSKLLYWLIPAYVAVAVVTTVFSWVSTREMVSGFMNEQMEAFAIVHEQAVHVTPLHRAGLGEGAYAVILWNQDGQMVDSSLPGLPREPDLPAGYAELERDGQQWIVYTLLTPQGKVQTFQSVDFRSEAIAELSNRTLLSLLLLIPLSSLIVWGAIRAGLRPLTRVARSAAAQNERNLSSLPLAGVPEEIQPLVLSINSLLARLRESFAAQQRFIHDAAHELRTPITALNLQLQNLRNTLPHTAITRIDVMEGGLQRAQRVVQQLLRLAREDAGDAQGLRQSLSLQAQLKASITALMPLADAREIDLGMQMTGDFMIDGQQDDLRSLLDNLIDNAVRYSSSGTPVDVRLSAEEAGASIEIMDEGPGIAPDQLPRVFDRFFRVLGTGVDGSGLGLAIARSAAERLGASIELVNRAPRGLIARVYFPQAAAVTATV